MKRIAEMVGIHKPVRTWRREPSLWAVPDAALLCCVTLAIARAKRRASITITQAILNGDVTADFRCLAYQEAEWRDTVQYEHSGRVEHRTSPST